MCGRSFSLDTASIWLVVTLPSYKSSFSFPNSWGVPVSLVPLVNFLASVRHSSYQGQREQCQTWISVCLCEVQLMLMGAACSWCLLSQCLLALWILGSSIRHRDSSLAETDEPDLKFHKLILHKRLKIIHIYVRTYKHKYLCIHLLINSPTGSVFIVELW